MLFLDEDPVICANNTPISLHKYTLTSIKSACTLLRADQTSYKNIHQDEVQGLSNLVMRDIAYSKKNKDWIIQYYNALSVIYKRKTSTYYGPVDFEFKPITQYARYLVKPLKIHSPLFDEFYAEALVDNLDKYADINDAVVLSRTILLDLEPTEDEFVAGIPDWVQDIKGSDFIAFDVVNRRYIKITKCKDGFRYYTSLISDNWKEILNVPKDMDYIIDYLISSRDITLD